MDSLMTLEEVASYLRVSERTVKEWTLSGELLGGKLGSIWRFRKQDVDSWLDKQLTSHKHSKIVNVDYTIKNLLDPSRVFITNFSTKLEILNFLIDRGCKVPGVSSRNEISDALFKREDLMSTGIGLGIAVPHVRLNGVEHLNIFFVVNKIGIDDYNSLDGEPVRLIAFFVVGRNQHTEYIKALSVFVEAMKNKLLYNQCLNATSENEIYENFISFGGKNE